MEDNFSAHKWFRNQYLNEESNYDMNDRGLTVGELIQKLSQIDPSLMVGIYQDSGDTFLETSELDLNFEEGYVILK